MCTMEDTKQITLLKEAEFKRVIKELKRERELLNLKVKFQGDYIEFLRDFVHTYEIELAGYSEGE